MHFQNFKIETDKEVNGFTAKASKDDLRFTSRYIHTTEQEAIDDVCELVTYYNELKKEG